MRKLGKNELEDVECQLLLEGIFRFYGFDFQDYSWEPIKQQIRGAVITEGTETISGLQSRILHDPACMQRFLLALSAPTYGMDDESGFFLALRRQVAPLLRTYPSIRIWQAGCSSLNELYFLAIVLYEEGLYDRAVIYATDLNEAVLQQAQDGLFPSICTRAYANLYRDSGGQFSFADYYTGGRNEAIYDGGLKRNIVFAQHDLSSDGSFNAFNVILCRHLLPKFNPALQSRAHQTFYNSLEFFGILGMGRSECLANTSFKDCYRPVDSLNRLYRKVQ